MAENVENILLVRLREIERPVREMKSENEERFDRLEGKIDMAFASSQGAAMLSTSLLSAVSALDDRVEELENDT